MRKFSLLIILSTFLQSSYSQDYIPLNKENYDICIIGNILKKHKKKYHDALIFELKGEVSNCVVSCHSDSNSSDSNPIKGIEDNYQYVYKFSKSGEYITDKKNYIPIRNSEGFLIHRSYTVQNFLTDNELTETKYYEYSDEKLIKEFGVENLLSGKLRHYEYKYEYNDKGDLILKREYVEGELYAITTYNILKIDSHGNWTEGIETTTYIIETTTYINVETTKRVSTRVISYFDDDLYQTVPSDAPKFGLG